MRDERLGIHILPILYYFIQQCLVCNSGRLNINESLPVYFSGVPPSRVWFIVIVIKMAIALACFVTIPDRLPSQITEGDNQGAGIGGVISGVEKVSPVVKRQR